MDFEKIKYLANDFSRTPYGRSAQWYSFEVLGSSPEIKRAMFEFPDESLRMLDPFVEYDSRFSYKKEGCSFKKVSMPYNVEVFYQTPCGEEETTNAYDAVGDEKYILFRLPKIDFDALSSVVEEKQVVRVCSEITIAGDDTKRWTHWGQVFIQEDLRNEGGYILYVACKRVQL